MFIIHGHMIDNLNTFILVSTLVFMGAHCILLLLRSSEPSVKIYIVMIILAMIWTLCVIFLPNIETSDNFYRLLKIAHFVSILTALSFTSFSCYYCCNKLSRKYLIWNLPVTTILYLLIVNTGLVISGVEYNYIDNIWTWTHGYLFTIYFALFITLLAIGTLFILNKYRREIFAKRKILYIELLASIFFGYFPPIITCLILPHFGIFDLYQLAPASVIILIAITLYSIYRHNLFSIKIISIEISLFALWLIIFIHTFLSTSLRETITESILLVIIVILGLFLLNNMKSREKHKDMLVNLEKDLRKLYEKI